MKNQPRNFCNRTRREFFWQAGGGFSGLALAGMLDGGFFNGQKLTADELAEWKNPLAAKKPHFAAKAKAVIFLFMYGGPSHIDTFDYKPTMYGMDNKTIEIKTFGRGGHKNSGRIVEPRWKFKQYGECGKWVSDLFPNVGTSRRRYCLCPFDDCRQPDPRFGHVADEFWKDSQRQSVSWLVGQLRAWQ